MKTSIKFCGKKVAYNIIKIDIKQVGNGREYDVFFNKKKIGSIANHSRYHDNYIEDLLKGDAIRLAENNCLLPKNYMIETEFIGTINHVKNN